MRGPPTRQTRAALENRRWTWYGTGTAAKAEKDAVGVFLDDVVYVFADVSLPSLPVLYAVMMLGEPGFFGVKTGTFVGWMAAVLVGTLIRGGWVMPLATDVPGWVSLKPSLVALRLPYYNAMLGAAAYLGWALASLGHPLLSVVCPAAVAVAGVAAFPAVADRTYDAIHAAR